MSYQPFLIAPFGTGLDTDQEPWLLPQDAFSSIQNAHIYHGVIEKRSGFKKWSEMVETSTNLQISGITQANPGVVTVTSAAALSNSDRVQLNYVAGMTEVRGQEYVVANVAGTTFELTDGEGNNVDTSGFTVYASGGTVSIFPGNSIMGINLWVDGNNNRDILVFDTGRAALYNGTNDSLEPLDTSDIMTSGDEDFIVASDWASSSGTSSATLNRLYFTNGKSNAGGSTDGIRYYQANTGSPPVTTQYNPVINSGAEIRGCKLIFALKQRLILFHTFEGGNTFSQRARWCQIQNPAIADAWDDNVAGKGGFVDAPTGDQIVSAQFLKDNIIVYFTNSTWLFAPTSDPSLPYRWIKLNSWRATDGKMASVGFDRHVFSMGTRGISATDGTDSSRIDQRIEDFTSEIINEDEFGKVFAKRDYTTRRLWWLYPEDEDTNSSAALIYDDESKAYSTYEIALNVLGDGRVSKNTAWDDFPSSATSDNPDDLPLQWDSPQAEGMIWQDYHWDAGAELLLGGDFSGVVNTMEFGTTDKGTNIPFKLRSAAWNPWMTEGKRAQLGYVDIFVDTDRDMILDVLFFKDNNSTEYLKKSIDLLPDIKQIGSVAGVTVKSPATDGVTVGSLSHGLSTGDVIYIYGILGMTELNGGPYTVTVGATQLDEFDIALDATGFTAYTSNGVVTESLFVSSKVWKRVYSGGIGYQHFLSIEAQEMDSPIRIHAFMPWFRPVGSRPI